MTATFILDPILPEPLVVVLGLALAYLTLRVYWRVGAAVAGWQRLALLGFRLAGIALVLLLLLQPSKRELIPPPKKERFALVALDTSASMKQRDAESAARLDAAKDLLVASSAVAPSGLPENPRLRLFEFSDNAQPITQSVLDLVPHGRTTRFHQSVQTMLNTAGAGESMNALILLTDGHDFELVNPVKTGAAARARQTPIYAVPFGKQGKVRDVSTRITSYQPYSYVKQTARVTAALRLIGCELEDITVQLLRGGVVVQTRRVNAEELQELPVEFEVMEPEVGQYEYEVRALPLEHEVDAANNSAITYLNVIDQQIRVLLVEGDPYWDTTFLQRSLMRNDKFNVDALVRYGQDRVRAIRKTEEAGPLKSPATLDQLAQYDVVFLGRSVDRVLNAEQIGLLQQFVRDRNGTVIFCRGAAFEDAALAGELSPAVWSGETRTHVRLDLTAEGRGLSAWRSLNEGQGGWDSLPEVVAGRAAAQTEPLTATLATGTTLEDSTLAPAIVHRRYGRGQVVSIGVEGLWRWGLNSKIDGANSPFDRFWDQTVLWLLAGRDFIPTRQFSFRPNSANILLGEKVSFRLTMRQPDAAVKSVPLTLFHGEKEIGRANLTGTVSDPGRLMGEFLPERVGRYRALAKFPDGTSQESRFIVFNENLEETEVATDVVGLRRLCESSGGRIIEPAELGPLLKELASVPSDAEPQTQTLPVWNAAWVFYAAGLLFGLDWFLRRRWGLA
jgi:hypothetical protein